MILKFTTSFLFHPQTKNLYNAWGLRLMLATQNELRADDIYFGQIVNAAK